MRAPSCELWRSHNAIFTRTSPTFTRVPAKVLHIHQRVPVNTEGAFCMWVAFRMGPKDKLAKRKEKKAKQRQNQAKKLAKRDCIYGRSRFKKTLAQTRAEIGSQARLGKAQHIVKICKLAIIFKLEKETDQEEAKRVKHRRKTCWNN